MCSKGGFHLNKWISNHCSVLAVIPEEERAKEVMALNLDREKLPVERAPGTQWDVERDAFTFTTLVKPQPVTRRGILSVVSSVYDPLGFLAPVVLSAKQILRELCKAKHGWDKKITQQHVQRWQRWLSQLVLLDIFYVSRCITPKDFSEISAAQLYHFCDTSDVGLGSVSYLRLTNRRDESEWPGHDEEPCKISVDDPEVRNIVSVCAAKLYTDETIKALLHLDKPKKSGGVESQV
ncbi:hypothetical protein N1851_028004 [Merluccius polli]|uniref:Uncharacterized protein n=1 Tax=Merluccius polli TaxID=89951 RepID=A0AA47M9K6_MERPO|nr:hypothetical protein N1851_028004 [Merluccius polli]